MKIISLSKFLKWGSLIFMFIVAVGHPSSYPFARQDGLSSISLEQQGTDQPEVSSPVFPGNTQGLLAVQPVNSVNPIDQANSASLNPDEASIRILWVFPVALSLADT